MRLSGSFSRDCHDLTRPFYLLSMGYIMEQCSYLSTALGYAPYICWTNKTPNSTNDIRKCDLLKSQWFTSHQIIHTNFNMNKREIKQQIQSAHTTQLKNVITKLPQWLKRFLLWCKRSLHLSSPLMFPHIILYSVKIVLLYNTHEDRSWTVCFFNLQHNQNTNSVCS